MQWNPAVWFSDTKQYLMEVRTEFRKVTWPTQKEATAGTIGVLVVIALITIVLSGVDLVLGQVMRFVVP
jgi:preprotein translocase subunit SecE